MKHLIRILLIASIGLGASIANAADYHSYTSTDPIPSRTDIPQKDNLSDGKIAHLYYRHKLAYDTQSDKFKCYYTVEEEPYNKRAWWSTMDHGKSLVCPASVYHSLFGVDLAQPVEDKNRLNDWKHNSDAGRAYEKLMHLGNEGWNTFKIMASKGQYQ